MMVKYISFMIILGVSLLFTSCVYHFDLDEAEGIPKLVAISSNLYPFMRYSNLGVSLLSHLTP